MAGLSRKSWKLQDFMAHNANVNCLALGHKSGRVMVTGGDDRKVNLWAIGRQGCFMSLSGHTTPIECVQFNQLEELVCAGSRAGPLKLWDLEAAKLVRTLNGHKHAVKCVDFHPYGDVLASGSVDTSIRIWDSRRKSCTFTYNGHKSTINSLKFSPDGLWIASGSDDSTVKIWDLRVGRVLKEFGDHLNSVTCVEFHPHEFLLATGSTDRSVSLFDLEKFEVISSEQDLGIVRCLCFNPDGECLFVGIRDYLKVVGWEPSRLFDSVPVNWSRVCDISIAQNQLVGASFHLTNVQVFVVDLKKVKPLALSTTPPLTATTTTTTPTTKIGCTSTPDGTTSPFTPNQSIRKSFSKAERPISLKNRSLDVKTIEESTSGTDPEEESLAEVTNLTDYNEIFHGKGLSRTPPPLEPVLLQESVINISDYSPPQILSETNLINTESPLLDNYHHNNLSPPSSLVTPQPPAPSSTTTTTTTSPYSRSKSNLDQVYISKIAKQQDRENILPNINKYKNQQQQPKFNLQRQCSYKDVQEGPNKIQQNSIIKHSVSDANICKSLTTSSRTISRKNSFSKPSRNNSNVPNVSTKIPPSSGGGGGKIDKPPQPVDIYVNNKLSPDNSIGENEPFVPQFIDKPIGLDFDDFLPKNHRYGFQQQMPNTSETDVLNGIFKGHDSMLSMLASRQRSLKLVLAQYRSKDLKSSIEAVIVMDDLAVLVDFLGVLNLKSTLWSLDLCTMVLPKLQDLLNSKFESYVTTGCNSLRLIVQHFGHVIKNNIQSPIGSFGVDIPREERYQKSLKCHEILSTIRSLLLKRQNIQGPIGVVFKEIHTLIVNTFD